jgi:hypothetical protein
VGAAAGVVAGLLLATSPASATATCTGQAFEQPFASWGDEASYVLAPNGDFGRGGEDWALTGGASAARDEADGRSALALPPGSSATSSPMCIDLDYPTMRFFARNAGASESRLAVSVRFRLDDGAWRSLKIADLQAGEAWEPTRVVRILANYLAYYPEWDHQVSFRFTPSGGAGDWRIDDVYVDPYAR